MSVRLFHRHARLVMQVASGPRAFAWYAFHRQSVKWEAVFTPPLLLLGFSAQYGMDGLRFGDGGTLRWTRGLLWTTIRLQLPPCSEKKTVLLAAGLLKAARYGEQRQASGQQRQSGDRYAKRE